MSYLTDWKYTFDTEPEIGPNSEVKCPECKEWDIFSNWAAVEVGCEECGSHTAVRCHKCGHDFDHVHSPTFETRIKQ